MMGQRRNDDLEDAVRAGLEAAAKDGIKLEALLSKMKVAPYDVKASYDTVLKFRQGQRKLPPADLKHMHRFFREHPLGQALSGAPVTSPAAGAVRSLPAPLAARIGPAGPAKPENLTPGIRLASIHIEATQWGAGVVAASVTVACPVWRHSAVHRGRITMDPHPGRLTAASESAISAPKVIATELDGRSGRAVLARACSTPYDPFWEVTGIGAPIGGFTTGGDFAPLENLAPGNRVTVTFGTWLGDIAPTEAPESTIGDRASTDDDITADSLMLVTDTPPEAVMRDPRGHKRRLIALIRQTALDVSPDGYVELSRAVLDIGEG